MIPSVFSFEKIALTAAIATAASLIVLWIIRRRTNALSWAQVVLLALGVGFSVLAWHMAGNVAQLNDDPIPPFSPNDLLCPIVTYVLLGIYADFQRPADRAQWDRTRAWLTLVSFVVNVLFI
ncbi:MAG: hypothetical protein WCF84_19635 [Anaerolineae bacterium]